MKMRIRGRVSQEIQAGISSSIEAVLAFAQWAQAMGPRLTPESIRKHYGCSRATSYRWFNAYRAASERMAA